jgi:phosphoglucomutase
MLDILDKMILSASGWRGIFATNGDEESVSKEITDDMRIVVAAAAWVFANSLDASVGRCVLVGTDARPTGSAIAAVIIRMLLAKGCTVCFPGVVAAPEIMAAARQRGNSNAAGDAPVPPSPPLLASGFIYISASHNPIGHNGIKFGLTDGGVLSGDAAARLAEALRHLLGQSDARTRIETALGEADESAFQAVYARSGEAKKHALAAYRLFIQEVWTGGSSAITSAVRNGLRAAPIGIVADLNGSARTASIDRDFFEGLGIPFKVINGETGKIAHRIVPEGESLIPCCRLLEEAHRANPAYVLGYVCDCDGDRGNLVIWDEKTGGARPLMAQEVFAISVVAELAHLAWMNGGAVPPKTAVAVNDATSMRIDAITRIFKARTFHAEVGEANVVGMARKMRETGWTVPILGEGAAGGNITHPSAVRDPLATVMAIVKLLAIRGTDNEDGAAKNAKHGLYKLWCAASGQPYRADFTLSAIIGSLPPFATTSSYEPDAILRIKTEDHALLKERYQRIFEREWETRKAALAAQYGIVAYEAWAYKGTEVIRSCRDYSIAGRGGLRIMFYRDRRDSHRNDPAFGFIWMRGSGTEKAFRIMADIQGGDPAVEREFLAWQTAMVLEADG